MRFQPKHTKNFPAYPIFMNCPSSLSDSFFIFVAVIALTNILIYSYFFSYIHSSQK